MPEKTEAQKRAQKTYMGKFSRLEIRVTPEKQKQIQAHVEATGESINSFVCRAIDATMETDRGREDRDL